MSLFRYLICSLWYYRRSHLAVFLGVVAGTGVIAGALIVGDSVRGSLKRISLDSVRQVDYGVVAGRFFREELARELAPGDNSTFKVAPALVLTGAMQHQKAEAAESGVASQKIARVGKVHIYGIEGQFWKMLDGDDSGDDSLVLPKGDQAVISRRIADELGVAVGDPITLFLDLPSAIPRDSLLGEREEVTQEILLKVQSIAEGDSGPGRFSLRPNQQLPANMFVSLEMLQSQLGLARVKRSRRNKVAKPARVNGLFISTPGVDPESKIAMETAKRLEQTLRENLTLADLNLRLVAKRAKGEKRDVAYLSFESERLILENRIADSMQRVVEEKKFKRSASLVYLINEFQSAQNSKLFSMYSIVAGLDFSSPFHQSNPFGPFSTVDGEPIPKLGEEDIVINEWLANDLQVSIGDAIHLKYHTVESHGELPEETLTFRVVQILRLGETVAADQNLTPRVEGFTTVKSMADFDQPFPMDLDRVTTRDDDYWETYRATPKAFVSLKRAQQLWGSRYGQLTSLRIALPRETSWTAEQFEQSLLESFREKVELESLGIVVRPVKRIALKAANGTTDFAGLFIGFSLFLILGAAILVGLLFRLSMERRAREYGVLGATGFPAFKIRRIALAEAGLVSLAGSLLGLIAGIGYAKLMIYGLTTWWLGAIGTKELSLYLHPMSLFIGLAISLSITFLVLIWSLRMFGQVSTRSLLAGVVVEESFQDISKYGRAKRIALTTGIVAIVLTLAALGNVLPDSEAFSGLSWKVVLFFVVGILLLVSGLYLFSASLQKKRLDQTKKRSLPSVASLGVGNASRQTGRSMMTVAMLSCATFLVVAVAAGQYNPRNSAVPKFDSGDGGFLLVAESSRPILFDWNTEEGRAMLHLDEGGNTESREKLRASNTIPFRLHAGDESSCLNLYQTSQPAILGVPQKLIERGGFVFANTPGENPWEKLNEQPDDGTIPILGDMNTLMFSLHKGVGETIELSDSNLPGAQLKVVGMLTGSVFQGVVLMSEENFQKLYPGNAGYQYFLIEADASLDSAGSSVTAILETGLQEYGLDVEPIADRLDRFLAVQNTYLSTFQTLGGLGLLLGTFGLATVMLRNVWERRRELALFRAVGFKNRTLAVMVLTENCFLLLSGLAIGTAAALIAMFPHIASVQASVPWRSILTLLVAIYLAGMLTALLAVLDAVRTPIVETLHEE